MFDAILSILGSLTSSSNQTPKISPRPLDYPKSSEEAARRDWKNIQNDWEAIGLDMKNAINKVTSDVQTEQSAR